MFVLAKCVFVFVFNVPPIAIRSYRDGPMTLLESHSKEPWIELRTPGYNASGLSTDVLSLSFL